MFVILLFFAHSKIVYSVSGDCDFDGGLCTWKNDNKRGDIVWQRQRGPTLTDGTGPMSDHTSTQGYYMYTEASSRKQNDSAWLISDPLQYSNHQCITFWYHMYGKPGGLNVVLIKDNQSHSETIWSLFGNQGNHWHQGLASIPNNVAIFQVAFEGIIGKGRLGDIAIDDIKFVSSYNCTSSQKRSTVVTEYEPTTYGVTQQLLVTSTSTPVNTDMHGDCDFDVDMCTWESDKNMFLDWVRRNGTTPSNYTGPVADHTSGNGFYIYVESNQCLYHPSYSAMLSSGTIDSKYQCLTFWYNMYGLPGHLRILLSKDSTGAPVTIWSRSGSQGKKWLRGDVLIDSLSSYKIHFMAVCGHSYRGDIAIDDIKFTTETCDHISIEQSTKYMSTSVLELSTEESVTKLPSTYSTENTEFDRSTTRYMPISTESMTAGFCETTIVANIVWSKTPLGRTVFQHCPKGKLGDASRLCSSNGEWAMPSYINCIDEKLHQSFEKLKNLDNITNSEEATVTISEVLETVSNTTEGENVGAQPIKSGDLKKTTDILSSIIRIGNTKNASVNPEKFVDVINTVLNSENTESWNEVNKQDTNEDGSAKILNIVENLGKLVQRGLLSNETKRINKTNLEIEISTLKQELVFPSNSKSRLSIQNQTKISGQFFTAAIYRTLSNILPTEANSSIGSDILSVSFEKTIGKLEKNITMAFDRNKKVAIYDPKITCGYWNFTDNSWAFRGCYLKQVNSEQSICTCNHLTNFAVLMSPQDVEISDIHTRVLDMITFIGCGVSIFGCFLTLLVYCLLWRYVRNDQSVIISNICVALIIGYSFFLGAVNETGNDVVCIVFTAILHYVFLVVFFVMFVEGIVAATLVTVVFQKKSRLTMYLFLAWTLPSLIVGITLGITKLEGYHSDKYCWLNMNDFIYMAFVGPAAVIILINIIIIAIVLRALCSNAVKKKLHINKSRKQAARDATKCILSLLPVLGLTWVFGILSFNKETLVFKYLFCITTACQGLLIFIFHIIFNKKVRDGLLRMISRHRSRSISNFTSKTKSSGLHSTTEVKGCNNGAANKEESEMGTTQNNTKLHLPLSKSSKFKNVLNISHSNEYNLSNQ